MLLQGLKGVGGLVFLPEAHRGIENQQGQNNDEVVPVSDQRRQNRRDLDHPGDRTPEIAQQTPQETFCLLLQRIAAILPQTGFGIGRGQPCPSAVQLFEQRVDILLISAWAFTAAVHGAALPGGDHCVAYTDLSLAEADTRIRYAGSLVARWYTLRRHPGAGQAA